MNNYRNFASISSFFLLLVSLNSCAKPLPKEINFVLKNFEDKVEFHTEAQLGYMNSDNYASTSGFSFGSQEIDKPLPIQLTWESDSPKTNLPTSYLIRVSENEDLSSPWVFESSSNSFDLFNCKISTTYYWQVEAIYKGHSTSYTSNINSFVTTDVGPRNIYVDGIMNVRDLGGHGIKQGLIYRSARFNESKVETPQIEISDDGIKTMVDQLGIKAEIDLRRISDNEVGGITSSPLGNSVVYYQKPLVFGGNNILTYTNKNDDVDNPSVIKEILELLADRNNYPLDFHCTIGKDRTGCISYLLEALCGVSEDYMYRDYMFSNFSKIGGLCKVEDINNRYGSTIKNADGGNLAEKAYNYLIGIGVSSDTLDNIISILKA